MRTHFIEATQGVTDGFNHGKFMVAMFDDEWSLPCELDRALSLRARPLLNRCGWTREHLLVMDLQTGEGAIFRPGGSASADLGKHKVWVCPMFEPFLEWLYEFARETPSSRVIDWFDQLPVLVKLPEAAPAMSGYRRDGPG